ncbi:MAG: 30S ribosomal protein S2 [Minisyncoccales bacterium]
MVETKEKKETKPASAKTTKGKEEKEDVKKAKKVSKKETDFKIDTDKMLEAGVHFGHRTSRLHPKVEPYLAGIKNTIHIIDLEKTAKKLEEALKFIQELISENKALLLVGTKIQIKNLVKEIAEECTLPYVNERWLGGTLTNFEVLSKRVEYLKEIEKKKASGEWEKYTKKERIKMDRELQNMKTKFEGLKKLERIPAAIFVLDIRKDDLAVKEARMKGVKIIAICDTNVDPTLVDYPIPGNDDAISSVKYILEKVKETILKIKK